MAKILMPLKPTWHRYINIFWKNRKLSMLRALEYEALARVNFSGEILDFGGGRKANYYKMISDLIRDGSYESVNISHEMEATYLVQPDQALDLGNKNYNLILAINTLEHVFCIHETIEQLISVLKPGGRVVFITPFLYRVHGSPHDYNRPTAEWWSRELETLGLVDIQIEPLMWDAFSTGIGVSEKVGPLYQLRKKIIALYGIFYKLLRDRSDDERYMPRIGQNQANFALGYCVQAQKPIHV